MLSNLQEIKDLVSIRAVADYLGLEEEYGKRKFPGERTASIQLYKDNRFHDFGRNVDGDIFDLMIHVRGYTLKEAIPDHGLLSLQSLNRWRGRRAVWRV